MVSRPNHPRTPFGTKLVAELERQDISARELARRMNPTDPGTQRRSIARWMAPVDSESVVSPSRANRRAAALALGLDETAFDEDDEEVSSFPTSHELGAALNAMIERAVQARLEQALSERSVA